MNRPFQLSISQAGNFDQVIANFAAKGYRPILLSTVVLPTSDPVVGQALDIWERVLTIAVLEHTTSPYAPTQREWRSFDVFGSQLSVTLTSLQDEGWRIETTVVTSKRAHSLVDEHFGLDEECWRVVASRERT